MGNLNVVYFILFIGYFCQGVVSSRPKIKPAKNEYIIGSNTDFNLTCTGDEPITWTYPNVTLDGMFMSFISVSVRESADENHLKVLPKDVQDLYAPQNSNAILDCRPTSPDVTVTLENSNEEMVPCEFDPKIGFTLKRVSLLDSEQYTCKFVYKNISQEHIIILFVTTKPTAVEKPFIETSNNGRISVGQNLTLNCTITVEYQIYLNIEWKVPDEEGFKLGRITKNESIDLIKGDKACKSVLTVTNVSKKDAGKYICSVKDHVNNTSSEEKEITVLDIGESHISLNNTGMHEINETAGASIRWVIKIDAYPPVIQQIWRNNKGDEINQELKNQKYVMEQKTPDSISLKINYITLNDSGMYQFEVSNEIESKILNLTLNVLDKPAVEIETQNYHRSGEISQLQCLAAGNPLPTIEWWFKPCQNDSCKFLRISEKQYSLTQIGLQTVSTLNLTATVTGLVRCKGFNSIGNDSDTKGFYVTDVEEGFNIWGIDDTSLIALGDDIKINCAVSVYNYTNNLNWEIWKDNSFHPIIKNDRIYIERNTTDYTYRVSLTINSITHNDSANYACVARNLDNYKEFLNVTIIVNDPKKAKIINTNLNGTEKQIKAGEPVTLYCDASGIPVPNIIWKKDNLDWSIRENHSHIILSEDNKMLNFKYVDDDDTGEYSCKAENRLGSDTRKTRLLLMSNKSTWSTALLIIMIVLAIVFVGLVAVLVIKIKKEKKLRRELRIAGLQNFEKGALESLNPELGVDDQAELLPYDKKWEFPRDKLKLGKQLGSGAFGVVMKADAFGLVEGETVATVAVKMVKRNADYTYIKALASELKIMVHLGKHLNVVNLLGACTKNVTKRELLVIVEYCRYGNLHNYLFRHREDFVNQIDPKTGLIDVTIGEEILNRTMSSGSNHSRSRSLSAFAGVDYRLTPNPNSCNTESTTVCTPTGEDSLILSNNSVQPEWRSNYRGDYNKGNVKPISSSDLLCWAFQVARGMEYLASRKVLHGDLAARNILLAEDNIVKICDFGLAKSMYKSDNYKKKGDGPLPVKWMAVESIRDRVFSTQSDVWSYGIVLWEFFSLARTPYPGMDADERLYNKLVDGYRMDQPEFSTKEIYQIMMECWHAKPTYRPSFSKLAENLGFMLQESVRQHYIELNDPYIQMNNTLMEGHSDYLAMLSPPDYGNLSSPSHDYINQNPIPDSAADASASGYLPMDIFSPKPNASIFDFEVHKKQKNADDTATGTELLPILHTNESDGELSPTSPVRNISNPNYRNMTLDDDKCKIIEPKKEIVHNSDNYINMPQQKKALKNTDAFSNPSYIELNKKIEEETNANNYVNSQSRDWERL